MESVRKLKSEKTTLQTTKEQLHQKEEQAMYYLNWYYKLKAELENNPAGAQIDDIKHFIKAMNELEIRGYRASYIISELEELQAAPLTLLILADEIEKLLDKKTKIMSDLKFYLIRFSEYRNSLPKLAHLENIGFGYDQLLCFTRIIEKISKQENVSVIEAATRFLKGIEQQYFKGYQYYF